MSQDTPTNANVDAMTQPAAAQPAAKTGPTADNKPGPKVSPPLRSRAASGEPTAANGPGTRFDSVNPAEILQKLTQTAKEALAENKAHVLDFTTTGQENTAADNEAMAHPDSGIEILVKMAEKGEIDPKNVDIIDVCDKFLKAIASTPKESLRMSGKVIFHAAVLLRLKAEALLSEANNTINPVVDDFLDFDADGGPIIYDSNKQEIGRQLTFKDLEGAIVRRAQRKQQVRERRITLDQLIAALKEAEKLETIRHDKKPKAPRIDLSGYTEVNDVDDILDLAHDEDIEGTIAKVEQWLAANLLLGDSVELFQLITKIKGKQDWVEAFLAALFLSNAGKIDLAQETFYGPLYLSLCQQNTDTVGDTSAKSG